MNHLVLGLDIGTNSIGWAIIDFNLGEIIRIGTHIFPQVTEASRSETQNPATKNKARRTARLRRRIYLRRSMRSNFLNKILADLKIVVPELEKGEHYKVYEMRVKALDERIDLAELARIWIQFCNRRGFKSGRKDLETANDEKEQESKSQMLNAISDLAKAIEGNFRTMGEYFYDLLLNRPADFAEEQKVRLRHTSRDLYEKEFNLIWAKQKTYYSALTGDPLPKNSTKAEKKAYTKTLYYKVHRAVFFQRGLKSQKKTVQKCELEPKLTCCRISAMEFQEFRIWQKLNDLRFTDKRNGLKDQPLNLEQKRLIAEHLVIESSLNASGKLSYPVIAKLLGLPKDVVFNMEKSDYLPTNRTALALKKIWGSEYSKQEEAYFSAKTHEEKRKTKLFKIWHILLYAPDDRAWFEKLAENTDLGLSPKQATDLYFVNLEEGYATLSLKAIEKLLPLMKERGLSLAEAKKQAYPESLKQKRDSFRQKITPLRKNEIRNPTVQKAIAEVIKLVNDLMAEYPIGTIRLETNRDLKHSPKMRAKMDKSMKEKRDKRREMGAKLFSELGMTYDTKNDTHREILEKYVLWLEADKRCPYTHQAISLQQILSSQDIDIEHIIPLSRSQDNSLNNKTICYAWFNRQHKENKTPREALGNDPKKWAIFEKEAQKFPSRKRELLLAKDEDITPKFLNRQLVDTSYINRQLLRRLGEVCQDVEGVSYMISAKLRRKWLGEKDRSNHLHHAVDACVVACIDRAKNQLINHFHARKNYDRDNYVIDPPWQTFAAEVQKHEELILVSNSYKEKLLSLKKPRIRKKSKAITDFLNAADIQLVADRSLREAMLKHFEMHRKNTEKPFNIPFAFPNHEEIVRSVKILPNLERKSNFAVHGRLHAETFYGKIKFPSKQGGSFEEGKEYFTIRKDLKSFETAKQVEKVVDKTVREILQARIKEYKGNVEEAFAQTVYHKDGKTPIKKVKITSKKNYMPLRKQAGKQAHKKQMYVATDGNYGVGIYRDPQQFDKVRTEVITFYEAVQRKIKRNPVFQEYIKEKKDTFKLWTVLKKNDMVLISPYKFEEIPWHDRYLLGRMLYRVLFISEGDFFFELHTEAKTALSDANKTKKNDLLVMPRIRSDKNMLTVMPVRLDRLGNVKPKKVRF